MGNFNTVWSIDLGKSSLKAVKLRREKNNIEILAIDKIDYPIGPNGIDTVQQAREALNVFKVRNEVKEPVVVAHPGQGTFSRFIKVPSFEAKKLKEMVGYEASQQIPFPLDEVIWDYHLVNRDYLQGEEREVGIFAVRREAIDDFLLDFTSEGLQVEMLSIGYLGLVNYVFYDIAPQEPSIVVDIGATHTDLLLTDGKKFWVRALPHSGNDINKSIMEKFKISFQEAEKLKIESGKAPQQAAKIFGAVIQPKLKDLVGEIHRSVGYYRSQAGEVKFQNLYLLGNGTKVVGIKKYLGEQLGLQVHRVQTIRHFRVNRDVDLKLLQGELPAFGTAFGCALQGVGAGTCRVDLVPQEERVQKDLKRKKKHVFVAMGLVYAAILLAYFVLNGKIEAVQGKVAEYKQSLKNEVEKFKSKSGTGQDPAELARKGRELERIAEVRSLALGALRAVGAVVPRDNAAVVVEKADQKKKGLAEAKVKSDIAELNKKKLWIPWLKIERVEWPEMAAATEGAARKKDQKSAVPTVPAYKVSLLATVAMQANDQESVALIRKLLIEPLQKKLKDSTDLTIDPQVKVSDQYVPNMEALSYIPASARGSNPDAQRGPGRDFRKEEEIPQEAGPFFGTQVSFYLRLRVPKEEVVVVQPTGDADEEADPKKKKKKK